MNGDLIRRIEQANKDIRSYSLKKKMGDNGKYTSEGIVDVEHKSRHFVVTIGLEDVHSVEYYWIEEEAYGRPTHTQNWFNIWVPGPPKSHLHAMLPWLSSADPDQFTEGELNGEECWIISTKPDMSALRRHAGDFVQKVLTGSFELSEKEARRLDFLETELKHADLEATFFVSHNDDFIKKIEIQSSTPKSEGFFEYHISNINNPELKIEPPREALDAQGRPMSFGLLFIRPSRWGWKEYNHCKMTEIALNLIKDYDSEKRYAGIYDDWPGPIYYKRKKRKNGSYTDTPNRKSHPCVLGNWAEDAWDSERLVTRYQYNSAVRVKKFRSFRHFGSQGKGLKWEDYFKLISSSISKPNTGFYISAFDWGKEDGVEHKKAGESGDKMNFKGAIEAHNLSSATGKKEAYMRIGHVLHLLQDLAQPDHAACKDHAMSGKDEEEAFKKVPVCEARMAMCLEQGLSGCLGAGPFYPICAGAALAAAVVVEVACRDYEDEVGFEMLVKRKWNSITREAAWKSNKKTRVKTYKQYLNEGEDSYDDFFKKMANESKNLAQDKGLTMPLGLGSVTVSAHVAAVIGVKKGVGVKPYETIPGLDPDIDITDPDATKPYLDLAREVMGRAIMRSAALLQHFYEIVNPPPYVERVVVFKGVPGLKPVGFAKFSKGMYLKNCSKVAVRYDTKWAKSSDTNRMKRVGTRLPLSSSHSAYVFILFGPRITPSKSKRMQKNSVSLRLTSTQGALPNPDVILTRGYDNSIGEYYWGSFRPINKSNVPYSITLEIDANDKTAHLKKRKNPGSRIDSNPAKITLVDADNPPNYPLKNYNPGKDRNHSIDIAPPIVDDQFEPNNSFNQARQFSLSNPSGDSKAIQGLTLPSESDVDYFLIKYASKPKHDRAKGRWSMPVDGGLVATGYPPKISISVEEKFGECLALEIFKSDQSQYKDYGITTFVAIDSPAFEFGPKKGFYLVITNPDFTLQGKLQYDLRIRYSTPYVIISGKLLYKFWEYTSFPYPPPPESVVGYRIIGDPPESILYYDFGLLVTHLCNFLPQLELELGSSLGDNRIRNTRIKNSIAKIAYTTYQYDHAADLFRACADEFQAENLITEALDSLRMLREIFLYQDRTNEVEEITREISQLR